MLYVEHLKSQGELSFLVTADLARAFFPLSLRHQVLVTLNLHHLRLVFLLPCMALVPWRV